MNTLLIAASGLVLWADPVPTAEETRAGWGAFALFVGMAVAVGLLGWSLIRHLRTAERNADAGAFGEAPESRAKDLPQQS